MLKWQKNYYVGEKIKKPRKIQSRINAGKLVPGIYLVTLSENPGNIMEIIQASMLVQKTVYDRCPLIIGMTEDKGEAVEFVRSIVEEVYKETGGFNVKEYMKNR